MGAAAEPACYVYGIVPEDVELDPDARGVGDPPGRIRLVRHGDIAALISDIDPSQPLRRPADLRAHRDLLDAAAAEVPVLPVRFGTIVADGDALTDRLLSPHHDEFAAALRELEGHAEYLIEARYDDGQGEDGQGAQAGARGTDGDRIAGAVAGYCAATRVREPSGRDEEDGPGAGSGAGGAEVAVLMATAKEADLERALEDLAGDWEGRVRLRLRGPIAPYDFVSDLAPRE